MIRLVFVIALLFALPTVCYALWQVLVGLRRGAQRAEAFEVETMPWRWLSIAGAVCAVIGVAAFITGEVTNPGQAYRPPPSAAGDGK